MRARVFGASVCGCVYVFVCGCVCVGVCGWLCMCLCVCDRESVCVGVNLVM